MKKEYLKYDGDFSNIVPISDLKRQVIINALSFTKTVKHAAKEVGMSERNILLYIQQNDISKEDIKSLRKEFKERKIKIKRRYEE